MLPDEDTTVLDDQEEVAVIEEEIPAETDVPDDDADTEDEQEEEVELIEFSFGGNKMTVPKDQVPEEVAAELDKFSKGIWSDYSSKSEGIKQTAESLKARESAVEKFEVLNGEALSTYSRGMQLQNELQQLQSVDINQLWQSEPDRARQISDAVSSKQAELNTVIRTLGDKEQELSVAQQSEVARRQDEGKQLIEKTVKNFEAEHLPAVLDYAVSNLGVAREDAEHDWSLNPQITLAVYDAMRFRELQAKAKKPATKQAVTPVTPAKTSGASKSQSAAPSDKDSTEVWLAKRNRQLQRRA